ncbi:hypothetical protein GGR54DRAFT_590978 [Hypoxylon sp. NC1633]|nr:hypothetical protein GGR54DRAFT_590978 [Hypoxylon sp. NC1633]
MMLLPTFLLSLAASSLAAAAPLTDQQLDDFYTRLVYWDKCSYVQQAAIKSGWESIWPVQQYFVDNDIDFNSAAALEYLGPAALTGSHQARMRQAIKAHATVQPGWTDWFAKKLHVRCDDPSKFCDKCGNTGPWAYTSQKDSKSGLARINFCPRYFNAPDLGDQISHFKSADPEDKADMENYCFSKGHVWYHELMHIDWASGADGTWDSHVTDIKFTMKDTNGKKKPFPATGPLNNKILARNAANVGTWTSQNADSYTIFALSTYVQSQIGIYPHLPLAPLKQINPRYLVGAKGGEEIEIKSDGTANWDASAPIKTQVSDSCFVSDETNGVWTDIDKFSTEDQYPQSYKDQWKQWLSDAGGSTDPGKGDFKPLPSDKQPSCSGSNLNANFPYSWVMLDGQAAARDILYRMRDQACQGKCQNIQGVPGNSGNPSPDGFFAAARQGDKGCEYAVKIAANKELYFYATNDGQNCYDATAKMIDTCISNNKKDAGWINGPNYGEFYQVGVRDMNGDGMHHGKFPDGNKAHLGYRQVACQRTDNGKSDVWYGFKVVLTNWDDGNYGRTIRDHAKKCGVETEWKYEDETQFSFSDGVKGEKYASWRLPLIIGKRCGEKAIEEALGLQEGSVTCNRGQWSEVAMF